MAKCCRCGGEKPSDRRDVYCKTCRAEYAKEWARRHPDRIAVHQKTYLRKNLDRLQRQYEERCVQAGRSPARRADSIEALRRQLLAERGLDHEHVSTTHDALPKVYFVQEGTSGPVKIGYTEQRLTHRVHGLQNGNPRPLRVLGVLAGGKKVEEEVHDAFAHLRIAGTKEWFEADEELLVFVNEVAIAAPSVNRTSLFARKETLTKATDTSAPWSCMKHGAVERKNGRCSVCRKEKSQRETDARARAAGRPGVMPKGIALAAQRLGVTVEEYLAQTADGNRYCKDHGAWLSGSEFTPSDRRAVCREHRRQRLRQSCTAKI